MEVLFPLVRALKIDVREKFYPGSGFTGLKAVVTAIGAGVAVWGVINLLEGCI